MLKRCAVFGLALVLPACGGGGGSPTTPTPTTPAGPTAAVITVAQNGGATVCNSPIAGFRFKLLLPVRVTESAGLGANLNFIRFILRKNGSEIERQEIGANQLAGANRLPASTSLTPRYTIYFNRGDSDADTTEFNFTDDRGNNQPKTLTNLQGSFVAVCPN